MHNMTRTEMLAILRQRRVQPPAPLTEAQRRLVDTVVIPGLRQHLLQG